MEDIALASLPKGPDSEVNSENGSTLLNGGNLASEPETDSDEDNNAHYFNQSVAYGIREKNGNVIPITEGSPSDEAYGPSSFAKRFFPKKDVDDDDDDNSFRHDYPNDWIIGSTARYACPFFKRNPQKYGSRSACSGPGWESVSRVKYVTYKRLGKYN